MTVYYRLIGSGETDANGVASYTYTGQGSGEVDLIASTSNPITGSSLVSETYSLYDTIFYDKATEEPPLNTWVINGFTPTYSENGTTLTSTSYATCFANKKNTGVNPIDWDSSVCVDFYITGLDSSDGGTQIYDNTNNCARTFAQLGVTGNNHVKILVESDKIRYFVDGVEKTSLQWNLSIGTFRVGLRGTGTITFKDFMIYPI